MSDETNGAAGGAELADKIKAGLDPANDAHWTKDGAPELAAVSELAGQKISRAQCKELLGDDYHRRVAAGAEGSGPTDEERIAGLCEIAGSRPVLLLDALERMSSGNRFSPPLLAVLQTFQQNRSAIHEYAKRIEARKALQASAEKSQEGHGLQRLRYTH